MVPQVAYLEPPTIPEGMTVPEYRRIRTRPKRRRFRRAAPQQVTRIDSPAMSQYKD